MKFLYTLFFIGFALLESCSIRNKENLFFDKYGNEDFSAFKNCSFNYRGNDGEGGLIICSMDSLIKNNNMPVYFITIDKKDKQIKKTNSYLGIDSNFIDKEKLKILVKKFIDYPIFSLDVDNMNNVEIMFKPYPERRIIRFSNMKNKTIKYISWIHLKDNWFREPKR